MKKILLLSISILLIQSLWALNPVKEYAVTPDDFGIKYEEVTFTTSDNIEIYGWFFKSKKASGKAMVMSHDGDGNMADLLDIAGNFMSLGYNVLMYDYRGYGKSGDFEIKNSFYIYAQFAFDLKAAITWVMDKKSGITNVQLYGQGIGAGLSLGVGNSERRITKIIADCPYSTLLSIQERYEQIESKKVMIPMAYDKELIDPTYALENPYAKKKKYLFIVGDKDQIVTVKDIKSLQKMVKSTATLYVVKGANCSNTITKDKTKYFETIKAFIK